MPLQHSARPRQLETSLPSSPFLPRLGDVAADLLSGLGWSCGCGSTYQTDNNAFKPQFKLYKYRAGGWRGQRDGSLALNGLWLVVSLSPLNIGPTSTQNNSSVIHPSQCRVKKVNRQQRIFLQIFWDINLKSFPIK